MLDQQQLCALLKSSGLRYSRVRSEIIRLLEGLKKPLSYMEIRQKLFGIKSAIIFKELGILQRYGLVESVVSGNDEHYFMFSAGPRARHHHCKQSCGCRSSGTEKKSCGGSGSYACENKNRQNPLSSH